MYSRVYVEITNICNMQCSFCHGHSRPLKKMTLQEFDYILDQLTGQTKYIYYHLMGEPLTHPELPLFLQLAAQRGFQSIITTNGTLLKRRGSEIIAAGLHKVNISLHSFEGTDEAAHLRYLDQAADFANTASNAGTIVVFRLWNRGGDSSRNDQAIRYLQSRIPGDWTENSRGIRVRDKLYLEWGDRFQWPDKEAPVQGEEFFCYGMRDHFGILSDGTVVPCCLDSDGVINLGNIFTENISDILSTERATAIAKGFEKRIAAEDLCRRCAYAQRFISK
jgi:radical SAM protein with 4Fe4S-binding SPASM domain